MLNLDNVGENTVVAINKLNYKVLATAADKIPLYILTG